MNGRWVKSQKIVKFPVSEFDPGNYLVPRNPSSRAIYDGDKLVTTNGATNHNTNEVDNRPAVAPTQASEKHDGGAAQVTASLKKEAQTNSVGNLGAGMRKCKELQK